MPRKRPLWKTRFAGGVTVALLAGAFLLPGAAVAQDDPGELLEDGRRAFERQNFEESREKLWAYLDATSNLTGAARMPQAEALYYIALMEPDAAVAGRHYQIIVDEFPASPVADDALHRLALLNMVEGRPDLAIQQFEQLRQNYPVSRYQPEVALWIGQARFAAGDPRAAVSTFEEGFARVKASELPREISMGQRDALAAEYAHWLARAHAEAGDEQTAMQYYTLLTLDYPDSPQAADARQVLASRGVETPPPAVASAAGEREPGEGAPGAENLPLGDEARVDEGQPAEEGAEQSAPIDLPPVAAALPQADAEATAQPTPDADPAGEQQAPREEEFEDIAVADPVAAAPEGVGRGEGRPTEGPPEEPAAEAAPTAEVTVERPAEDPVAEQTAEAAPEREVLERPAEERPIEPSEELGPPAKFGPGGGNADIVYLQVGAFTSATRAADLSKRLKEDDFNSSVQIAVVDGRGFYRVRVGPFRTSADAERIDRDRRRLTELGYPVEQVPATQ
ncbi:MAG: SPOR domain-containing protein [Gemmatimonadota bacterium]